MYWSSAEWSIATVFLVIAIVQLLLMDMREVDQKRWKPNAAFAGFLAIVFLIAGFLALTFSEKILSDQANHLVPVGYVRSQWVLLVLVSLVYLWLKALVVSRKS